MNSATKILLILDLDETLIHASCTKIDEKEPDVMILDYFVYKRPFLDSFLKKTAEYFDIAVWSSGTDDYVQEMVKGAFPIGIKLSFIWGRSRCTYRRASTKQDGLYNELSEYEFTKQLKKVLKKGYDKKRILIIEDTPEKVNNCYGNAIYISPFLGQPDDELKKLGKYLLTIKDLQNVRRIEKRFWNIK